MSITVALAGDHPATLAGLALDGYRRPLNGEIANLTVGVAHDSLPPGWLATPPLGVACTVSYAAETVMTGYLYGVKATAAAVTLSIEG